MKTKDTKKNQPKTPPRPAAAPGMWKRRLLLGLIVLAVAGGVWALFEYVVWSKIPSALVGKWVVVEGPDEGGTIDFYRNGTMEAVVNNRGLKGIMKARIRLEGKTLYVTTTHQETGEEGVKVQTIKILEGNRLVFEDDRGVSVKLERAK